MDTVGPSRTPRAMTPQPSLLIVTSKVQIDEIVAGAVERALRRHGPPAPGPVSEGSAVGYLTNRQAMAALGVSKATLARWRTDGTLPFSKVGASVFYAVADIDAALASRRIHRPA